MKRKIIVISALILALPAFGQNVDYPAIACRQTNIDLLDTLIAARAQLAAAQTRIAELEKSLPKQ